MGQYHSLVFLKSIFNFFSWLISALKISNSGSVRKMQTGYSNGKWSFFYAQIYQIFNLHFQTAKNSSKRIFRCQKFVDWISMNSITQNIMIETGARPLSSLFVTPQKLSYRRLRLFMLWNTWKEIRGKNTFCIIRNQSFITFVKCCEKLIFLTPWTALLVNMRKKCFFLKMLCTYWMSNTVHLS